MEVFLSFAHANTKIVEEVCQRFKEENISYWAYMDNNAYGDDFKVTIVRQIESAKVFVAFLSHEYFESDICKDELAFAKNNGIKIIPVFINKLDELPSEYKLDFVRIHGIEKSHTFIDDIVAAVKNSLGQADTYPVKSTKKPNKNIAIICALVCVFVAVVLIFVGGAISGKNSTTADEQNGGINTDSEAQVSSTISMEELLQQQQALLNSIMDQQNNATTTADTTAADTTVAENSKGENQIPEKYLNKVEAFEYADDMTKSMDTITLTVGEKVLTQSASTWSNCKIYSQNTAVAVGENLLIKGVSPGVTYVVVAANEFGTTAVVYKVIVTE
jgi:hypothetical protein